uniref:Protein SON n=1 Tax=Plectus sambesii TaxID=2011161 RepID=A0A914W2X3_9BILA
MAADVKTESSDAIIASLLDEFQKNNRQFNVESLLNKSHRKPEKKEREEKSRRKEKKRSRSRERKKDRENSDERRKHKKSKKSSKSKHRSKSPTTREHKKDRKSRTDADEQLAKKSQVEDHKASSSKDAVNSNSTEEELEKIRAKLLEQLKEEEGKGRDKKTVTDGEVVVTAMGEDEFDELPIGADAMSLNPPMSVGKTDNYLRKDPQELVEDDFLPLRKTESSFPLSKSGDAFAKGPSDILTKVMKKDNSKSSGFVPRNIKVKQKEGSAEPKKDEAPLEISKTSKESDLSSTRLPASTSKQHDSLLKPLDDSKEMKVEALKRITIMKTGKELDCDEDGPPLLKGPIRRKFGNDPTRSDDDDGELQIAPMVKAKGRAEAIRKTIVIGSLKSASEVVSRPAPAERIHGEDGEIPVSDQEDAAESSSDVDMGNDTDGELKDDSDKEKSGPVGDGKKPNAERVITKEKKEKEKKLKKHRKRDRSRSRSRSAERKSKSHSKRKRERSKTPMERTGKYRRRSLSRSRSRSPRRDKSASASLSRGSRSFSRSGKGQPTARDRVQWPWSQGPLGRRRSRSRSPGYYRSAQSKRSRRSRSRHRSRSGSKSRSRRSRSRDRKKQSESPTPRDSSGHIDKKKLFDIARRNASAMLQVGTLQQLKTMTADEIAKLKAGGRSIDELTEYCKKLQKRQDKTKRKEGGEVVTSSDSEGGKSEDDLDFINHPFEIKPNAGIILNIPNAVPLPVKTPHQRAFNESQLRITFPVSSGQQHREKEEWTPVEKGEKMALVPAVCAVENEKRMLAAPPAHKEKAAALASVGGGAAAFDALLLPLPPPPPPPIPPILDDHDRVFHEPTEEAPKDITTIVTQRLNAVKRLQDNPNDVEALKMMHLAEEKMKLWAESKNLPGQFTGSTGVQCLSANELGPSDPRFNAWAKKDLFKSASKIASGIGMQLMQKMGWKPGEGLGKDRTGTIEPLSLDVKSDRKGLVAIEEMPASARKPGVTFGADISGKHPTSVLMELCSKRRWGPPQFTCIESGPSNNRRFLWKVVVNNVEYQPAVPSNNKKTGKGQAAQVVLQSLGLVPHNPALPVVIG